MSNLSAQLAIFARSAIFVKTVTLQGARFALLFFAWFSIFARFASFVNFATLTLQGAFKFSPNLWRVFLPDWSFSPLRAFLDTSAACRSTSLHSTLSGFFSSLIISTLLCSTLLIILQSTLPCIPCSSYPTLFCPIILYSTPFYRALLYSGLLGSLLQSSLLYNNWLNSTQSPHYSTTNYLT